MHYRQMARIMSRKVWLWTEMVVDKTIIHTSNLDMHLWYPPEQHPIVLQVGGSDPETLRLAAHKIAPYGYDEVNLNCGCPSDRVAGAGCFGASMMLQPKLVASCMQVRLSCRQAHRRLSPPFAVPACTRRAICPLFVCVVWQRSQTRVLQRVGVSREAVSATIRHSVLQTARAAGGDAPSRAVPPAAMSDTTAGIDRASCSLLRALHMGLVLSTRMPCICHTALTSLIARARTLHTPFCGTGVRHLLRRTSSLRSLL